MSYWLDLEQVFFKSTELNKSLVISYLSLSSNNWHKAGNSLFAQSSSGNRSEVAANAWRAALRACTNGSFNDRVKAATKTFCLVYRYVSVQLIVPRSTHTLTPKLRAIFPRQIVVFVRIPGCSSFDVFARCFNRSPLIVRSDNFVIMINTALTVCSRTTGAISLKPVTYENQ